MKIPSMPFRILVLAPFCPVGDSHVEGKPFRVDKTNLDEVINEFEISFHLPVPKDLCPAETLFITCSRHA